MTDAADLLPVTDAEAARWASLAAAVVVCRRPHDDKDKPCPDCVRDAPIVARGSLRLLRDRSQAQERTRALEAALGERVAGGGRDG